MNPDSTSTPGAATNRIGTIAAQVAGPALAILAVTSIAWFLVEVSYSGPLVDRCKWIFALFSFAAVLISRISIEEGFERASGYGFLLAIATLMVTSRFMEGSLIGLALILAFVWWCAGRLTWDCTFIDNTRDATGQGMIDLAIDRYNRFRDNKSGNGPNENGYETSDIETSEDNARATESAWQTIKRVFFKRRQPNTPGLWAFYFLIGGLPLFGLGQLLMPTNDAAAHHAVAGHFFVYIVSVLGLLMLSSVTGLHRYLAKNNAAVPDRVAHRWLITGTVLALAIAAFTWLLPRPTPGNSLSHLIPRFSTNNLSSSQSSAGQDGQKSDPQNNNAAGGPESRDGRAEDDPDESGKSGGNQKSGDSGPKSDKAGAENSGGQSKGKSGGGGKKSKSPNNSGGSGKQQSKQNQSGGKQKSGDKQSDGQKSSDQKSDDQKSGESKSGEQKSGSEKSGDQQQDGKSKKSNNPLTERSKSSGGAGKKKQDEEKNRSSSSSQRGAERRQNNQQSSEKSSAKSVEEQDPSNWLGKLGSFFKFLVWCAAILVIAFFAYRYRAQILPWIRSFLAELAEFWSRLFNRKQKSRSKQPDAAAATTPAAPLPAFTRFQNPFANGKADVWSPEQIVTYTFRALEAWSRDQDCPREPEQTALEFARQTSDRHEWLTGDTTNLAMLYSQLAYARIDVSRSAAMTLAPLWDKLSALYYSAGTTLALANDDPVATR